MFHDVLREGLRNDVCGTVLGHIVDFQLQKHQTRILSCSASNCSVMYRNGVQGS